MTDAVFTPEQGNQFDALASVAWALLDAEAQGNRALAASAVPVFCASWNAWGSTVRMAYHDAPVSLSLAGGGWSSAHDDALKTTLAVLVQTTAGLSAAQIDHLLGLLDGMPSGMPFQAFRGVWFDTSFVAAYPGGAPAVFNNVDQTFARDGAAGLSDVSGQISMGVAPAALVAPSLVPTIPAQTSHPTPSEAASFVMPHSHVLPDTLVQGRAGDPVPTGVIVGIVAVAAIALAFGGYAIMQKTTHRTSRRAA